MGAGRQPEDPVRIVAAWREALAEGRPRELDLLTTRTCTVDLAGDRWTPAPLDRRALLELAGSLGRGLEDAAWQVDRVEQLEHRVVVDAGLTARAAGPLDLAPLGGPRVAGAGRRVEVPRQRLCWHILHGRVHEVEVLEGPGIGWAPLAPDREQASPSSRNGASNGNGAAAHGTNGAREPAPAASNGASPPCWRASCLIDVDLPTAWHAANGDEPAAPSSNGDVEPEPADAPSGADALRERVDAVIEGRGG